MIKTPEQILAELAITPTSKKPRSKPEWRSVFISDVHLGTKDCKARALNQFLKHHPCEHLFLAGDIIDGWKMQQGIFWRPAFSRVVKRLIKLSRSGVKVTYITGNHDEFLRKYANQSFDLIHLANKAVHTTADGRRLLVIRGDQFEGVTRCSGLLRYIGDHGYELLMFCNRQFNRWRARLGLGYWSFSGFLKQHIQRAQKYISDFEQAVAYGAKKQGYDGVVCGHIHHASSKKLPSVDYYNTGDWVESCTAFVEDFDGNMHLVEWLKDTRHRADVNLKKARKRTKVEGKHPLAVPAEPNHSYARRSAQ